MTLVDEQLLRSEVAEALYAERTHVCTVAVYSTRPPKDAREQASHGLYDATPYAALFPNGLYRSLLHGVADQLPRVSALRCGIDLRPLPEGATMHRASTMLLSAPSGAHVVLLWLLYDLEDRTPDRPFPELYEVIDNGRWSLRLAEEQLLKCAAAESDLVPDGLELGPDFHAITFLPPGSWTEGPEVDHDVAQRLVSRRDLPSRPGFLTARLPPEANRYENMLAAVTPGASAVAGHDEQASLALLLSVVEALACLSSLRQLQRRAYAQLRRQEMRGNRPDTLEQVEADARELQHLLLDLSFSVESFLDLRLLVPSLPVQQFHRDLVEALAIPEGAKVTGTMLERLDATLSAVTQELAAARDREGADRRDDEQRRRDIIQAAGAILAVVIVPLTLVIGFLGANVREVDASRSIFDDGYLGWYAALVLAPILVIALAALAVRRIGRT